MNIGGGTLIIGDSFTLTAAGMISNADKGSLLYTSDNTGTIEYTTGITFDNGVLEVNTLIADNFIGNSISTTDLNISGVYKINNVDVLTSTNLGNSIVNSSLTNLGILTGLTMGENIAMENNNITGLGTGGLSGSGGNIAFFSGTRMILTGDNDLQLRTSGIQRILITDTQTNVSSGDFLINTDTLYVDSTNDLIGMGTATPTAFLHLSDSTPPTLKIENTTSGEATLELKNTAGSASFLKNVSGDFLMGTSTNAFRINLASTLVDVFNNSDFAVDIDTLYVDSTNDRIGMGITNPSTKLHLKDGGVVTQIIESTDLADTALAFVNSSNSGSIKLNSSGYISINAPNEAFRVDEGNNLVQVLGTVDFAVDTNTLYVDSSASKVGIGTATPNSQLQLGNTVTNRKIVLFETVDNDHQYYGFGINNGVLRYQVDHPNSDHIFFSGIDSSSSKELIRFTGDGLVGIGTGTPNTSSALDITSVTGSLLIPRMTTTQRNALTATNGMLIYNTTDNKFQGYENGAWANLI